MNLIYVIRNWIRNKIKGSKRGHSGMDIHLERGNANKLMNRLLYGGLNYGIRISEINGGSLRNAIPRESTACVVVESEEFLTDLDTLITQIKSEYQVTEPDMIVEVLRGIYQLLLYL